MTGFDVHLRAVTPLVVGGAGDAQDRRLGVQAEGFRIPSIRGVLHWWFRAGWGATEAPSALLDAEREVFGGEGAGSTVDLWVTGRRGKVGTAYVGMNDPDPRTLKSGNKVVPKRETHLEGSEAVVHVRFREHSPSRQQKQFLGAFRLLQFLGGIGGRWRRGFGSIWEVERDGSWRDPIYGGDLPSRAAWLEREVSAAVAAIRASGAPPPARESGIRALRKDSAKLYLVEPSQGTWSTWEQAMDQLRDDFYREIKRRFTSWFGDQIDALGSLVPRQPSPVTIQIKPASSGDSVGVVVVWFSEAIEAGMGTRWAAWEEALKSPFAGSKGRAPLVFQEIPLP